MNYNFDSWVPQLHILDNAWLVELWELRLLVGGRRANYKRKVNIVANKFCHHILCLMKIDVLTLVHIFFTLFSFFLVVSHFSIMKFSMFSLDRCWPVYWVFDTVIKLVINNLAAADACLFWYQLPCIEISKHE
jgi:hypothetical protein